MDILLKLVVVIFFNKNFVLPTQNAIEQLMNVNKTPAEEIGSQNVAETKRGGYSWWWRRSGVEVAGGGAVGPEKQLKDKDSDMTGKEGDLTAVATQTSRSGTPVDVVPKSLAMPATPTEENQLNVTGNSDTSELNKSLDLTEEARGEMYRKSLRLTSEQIVSVLLYSTILCTNL